ncbi:hypothetical protein TBLA_0H00300 [Henningerozyma blattae CBS 6284]|uniref:RNA helicase n=1 Tax=Henningerozyma blattae (strain ATCC 34711 / CBS 6284 / DSM 70876 / NBRC 10599 / NRRL Y-10934 / UCD 77-7) TaxID=1071380 RepID=I2H7H1_HENB6|nr:hypothetical protein TBLA_0H00300 [Tetrapisispora blattae CBS 6284]CCH62323.1 hypothetical protein TBLA_0H00300 [Tetrapisispora blattae CBS 6284]
MGTYRKRFNEKARAGHMARLKELKRVRNKQFTRHLENNEENNTSEDTTSNLPKDSNAELLEPVTAEEKALKKRKLQELFTPKESKISRLKKKRLDKFIEHQLKREEKTTIIKKLQDYKMDTSILVSSKRLGHGRQTKKEEFAEALSLEQQGRGNEHTKEVLYEEHVTRDWDEDHKNLKNTNKPSDNEYEDKDEDEDDEEEDDFESKFGDTSAPSSSFIDNRPAKFGGSGFGFGFSNATVIKKDKKQPKKKYNWRQRIELQEQRKHNAEDEMDFESTDTESSPSDEGETNESESESIDDEDIQAVNEDKNSSDSESSNSYINEEDETDSKKFSHSAKAVDFKEWANKEIKIMEGRNVSLETPKLKGEYKPIIREEDLDDGLEETYIPINENSKRKAFYVQVDRSSEIQATRMALPVFGEEHKIMEAIYHNDVVIICGETGSGKTTQVPQFLYEAGFGNPESPENPGMIGITQPRRVAAVSMSERVGNELGNHKNHVGYQIRFDSSTKSDTRVKFMTDGVLLREMMQDFKLSKYSSIIIDEAHERNINTDILIGMLSRCVKLRSKQNSENPKECKKLKLIIMSATLRVSDFSENATLFSTPPPILQVAARQYPVAVHFNRRTEFNYADEAFRKTCKIHRRLPPGAILVFMTGQQEITHMVKKLRQEFPFRKNVKRRREMELYPATEIRVDAKTADVEVEDIDFSVKIKDKGEFDDALDIENDISEDEEETEEGFEETLEEGQSENDPLYVLPLYSLLPTKEQMKVFNEPPKGSRLCIVATNVAETSLTIPGVRYVVDCGRSKERIYNEETGVQSFEVGWISKASADQRSGRAGRTGPGHCYRLYSSAVFDRDFEQFSKPEILRMPVESIILQMKSMQIHKIINFPFPTPPNSESLKKSIQLLKYMGALDENEKITEEGRKMSLFPLSPRFSKILLVSNEKISLPYIVTIVSALSVGDPFIKEHELGIDTYNDSTKDKQEDDNISKNKENIEKIKALRTRFYKSRNKFNKLDKYSDIFCLLSAISSMDFIPKDQRESFLEKNFLRGKIMDEILKLRKQILYIIKSNLNEEGIGTSVTDEELKCDKPSEIQLKLLKQMICSGFIDQVVIRADELYPEEAAITNRTVINRIPYLPVLADKMPNIEDNFVYLHPRSIINNIGELPPKYLIYLSLQKNSSKKVRINSLCDMKSTALANIAKNGTLLSYSKPLTGHGMKSININLTERYCYVIPRFGSKIDNDIKIGWELNPIAVHEKKVNGQWKVEKFITNSNYKKLSVSNK